MKIAVNTRFLLDGKLEGLGWFTYETMRRIVINHPEHQFYFLFDRPFHKKFIFAGSIIPVEVFPPARHPVLWYLWFEWALPKVLKKIQPDVFVSTDGYIPLSLKIKTVNVIHDLNFEHYPENIKWLVKKYLLYYFPKFAKKATRIVTVSEYSKKDIVNTYQIPREKIDVAYNGASPSYSSLSENEVQQVRNTYSSGKPYFMYLGALLPRKNVARLLQAYDLFKKQTGSPVKMLIAGAKMFKTSDIEAVYGSMQFKDEVIFTGRLPEGEVEKVMGAALALTYISYFEGFGIPLVEAMYSDVPVITSDRTSLPEVAGNAAIIVDPFDTEKIKNALVSMATDENLRKKLIAEGREQRKKFNWDFTAEALWKSIEKAAL